MEKILCAAIWYKDLPARIDIPAEIYLPKNLSQGIVFCGHRHVQCSYSKYMITGLTNAESGEHVQGFLTSLNRFVDRKEALVIALRENQVINLSEIRGDNLFSEDLY